MDAATERRVLGLVGLGIRARNAVVGVEQVRLAARKGHLSLAIVAPDASENSLKKLMPLLRATGVKVVQGPGAESLGGASLPPTDVVVAAPETRRRQRSYYLDS